MAMRVMPSPRCSFNVNGALSLVPATWKPDGALVCGFAGAGVTSCGAGAAGAGRVTAGVAGLRLAGVLGRGVVASVWVLVLAFVLAFVLALVLAFVLVFDRAVDFDERLTLRRDVPACDLVLAALAFFADFLFVLAIICASGSVSNHSQQNHVPRKGG